MTARQKTERLLTLAAARAVQATNECPDYRQASELSRVVDLIDSAVGPGEAWLTVTQLTVD